MKLINAASISHLMTKKVSILSSCSLKTEEAYHMNDVSVYLDRQRVGRIADG